MVEQAKQVAQRLREVAGKYDEYHHHEVVELAAADTIDALVAEVERLKLKLEASTERRTTLRTQRDIALAEVERLTKDAERYRFLRDNPYFQIEYTGKLTLDEHIDAAMKEKP